MDHEQEFQRLVNSYRGQGYQLTFGPGPSDLPPFAKDFKVEIVGRRGDGGVLVSVKKDRDEAAADSNLSRYAEVTGSQKGWRFDFAVLEEAKPDAGEIDRAKEFESEDIVKSFNQSREMVRLGFLRPAVVTAWAGFEAAMRLRLRAAGERAGWGSSPASLLNDLYSNGLINKDEFRKLENLSRVRNQIVHGFLSSLVDDGGAVQFLSDMGRRLIEQSQDAKKLPA